MELSQRPNTVQIKKGDRVWDFPAGFHFVDLHIGQNMGKAVQLCLFHPVQNSLLGPANDFPCMAGHHTVPFFADHVFALVGQVIFPVCQDKGRHPQVLRAQQIFGGRLIFQYPAVFDKDKIPRPEHLYVFIARLALLTAAAQHLGQFIEDIPCLTAAGCKIPAAAVPTPDMRQPVAKRPLCGVCPRIFLVKKCHLYVGVAVLGRNLGHQNPHQVLGAAAVGSAHQTYHPVLLQVYTDRHLMHYGILPTNAPGQLRQVILHQGKMFFWHPDAAGEGLIPQPNAIGQKSILFGIPLPQMLFAHTGGQQFLGGRCIVEHGLAALLIDLADFHRLFADIGLVCLSAVGFVFPALFAAVLQIDQCPGHTDQR